MTRPIVLVVSLWIRNGDVAGFEAFELKAEKLVKKHAGSIDRAVRLAATHDDAPFEIHLVRFPDRKALEAYRLDPEVVGLLPEREKVVSKSVIVEGHDSISYFSPSVA